MAGLPWLPKSVLDESSTWDFASTTQNALSSLQQAGSRLMQPVRQQVEDVVRQALPAPAAPQPQQPAIPDIPSFTLPGVEAWGFGARAQPRQQAPEPLAMGPEASPAVQTPSAAAQTPSGGILGAGSFQGFSLPSLAGFGFGAQAPRPTPGAALASPTQTPASARPSAATAPAGEIDNSSRQAFVRSAWPHMLQAAGGNQDAAEMMLAAAISENGDVGKGGGFVGNNFFGIKGKGDAGSFNAATWEQTPSGPTNIRDNFAAYSSPVAGFGAFFDFLKTNSRYAPALQKYQQSGDARQLFRDVNAAGYATDPQWASKVENIRATQVAPITKGLNAAPPQPAADVPQIHANVARAFAAANGRPPTAAEAAELADLGYGVA